VRVIEQDGRQLTRNIRHVTSHLREQRSGQFVSRETIRKARESKALHNPIFAPYRRVLDYAELILRVGGMQESAKGKKDTPGFLVNVADLFETYIRKLLQRKFPDWSFEPPPELTVYEGAFFKRKMIPDIVMRHGHDVMVFDAKYKRMELRGRTHDSMGDVDRDDFFQIHTYMSYYAGRGDDRVIAGGLLYPMEETWNEEKCKAEWIGGKDTKFIIDGLDLTGLKAVSEASQRKAISSAEDEFIKRIRDLLPTASLLPKSIAA